MDNYLQISLALLAAAVFFLYIKNSGTAGIIKITPAEAKERLDKESGIFLLDVRTAAEYLENHIPKSISMPLSDLAGGVSRKIPDKNAEIIVYCHSGSRSSGAAKILRRLGYLHVYNLGGLIKWPYKTVSGKK